MKTFLVVALLAVSGCSLTVEDNAGLTVSRTLGCSDVETDTNCIIRARRLIDGICDDARVAAVELTLPDGSKHTVPCD